MPPLMTMSRPCIPWVCVIGGKTSDVGISFGAVQSILTDILGTCMSKVSARCMPLVLTDDQKRTHLDISRSLLFLCEHDPNNFIGRVVTQNETWVHHPDPESKMLSKQWKHTGSPPLEKFKRVHSAGKLMASIFGNSQRVIVIDYLKLGRMKNGAYYVGELRQQRQEIARKRREKRTRLVLLLRNNAPAHTSPVAALRSQ